MLQSIRNNLKGAVAVIVIGIMVVPLVLFGVDSIFVNSGSDPEVANVNGISITENELRLGIARQKDQYRQRFGDSLPLDLFSDEALREPVLKDLILKAVLLDAGNEGGMHISDRRVNELLVTAPGFQIDGKFSEDLYRQAAYNQNLTPLAYRKQIGESIVLDQQISGLSASGFITEEELERLALISQQKRNFYYLTIPLAPTQAEIEIDDEASMAYYEENKNNYESPEQVSIEYIEIKLDDIASGIEVSEASVREQYEQDVAAYTAVIERSVAHIFFEKKDDGSEQAKIAEVQSRLANGDDFATLAAEFSDDFGTKNLGGELGVISDYSVFPNGAEAALESIAVGEYTSPIAGSDGIHIVKLLDEYGATPPAFEEEKARIKRVLVNAEAEEIYLGLTEELAEKSYNASTLGEVAEDLNLSLQVSSPFGRSGGFGVASIPQVVEASFTDDVLIEGNTSSLLELAADHVLVLRVTDHQVARILDFEEVKAEIVNELKREQAIAKLEELGEAFKQEVVAGKSIEEIAIANEYEWQVSLDTGRADPQVPSEVLSHAFNMGKPDNNSIVNGLTTASGDYVLINLTRVTEADYASISDAEKTNIKQQLANMNADLGLSAYQQELQALAKIKQ
ncbi:SurA N-terminal domain-containing protein [Aurantivibrio infirmus]